MTPSVAVTQEEPQCERMAFPHSLFSSQAPEGDFTGRPRSLGGGLWSGLPPCAVSLSSCIPRLDMCLCVASILPPGTPVSLFLNLLLFTWWLAAMGPSFALVNSVNRRMHASISD